MFIRRLLICRVFQVGKRWIYDYLARVDRGLELLEAMTEQEQEKYLKR